MSSRATDERPHPPRPRRRHRLRRASPAARAGRTVGEAVFTTGMTGYQEVLTDPSYGGQIVTMTAPRDRQRRRQRRGHRERRRRAARRGLRRARREPRRLELAREQTLDAYLAQHGVVGITRRRHARLTRHLRDHGSQNGAIGTGARRGARATRARGRADMDGPRPREARSRRRSRTRSPRVAARGASAPRRRAAPKRHVVAIDFGIKRNILRCLVDAGCRVTVVPATHDAPTTSSRCSPTASSSRTAPAIRRRSATPSRPSTALARQEAALRHLPRPPAPRARARRQDLQAQVRPSRREPAGEGSRDRAHRDHDAEPRLLRRPRLARRARASDARAPERRHERRPRRPGRCARSACSTTPRRRRPARRAYLFERFARADAPGASALTAPAIDGERNDPLRQPRLPEEPGRHRGDARRRAERAGYALVDDAERGRGHRRQHLRLHRRGQEGVDRHHPRDGRATRRTARCKQLVVTGCLSQRYPDELAEEMPEVDHFLGSSDMLKLGDVLARRAPSACSSATRPTG